MKIINKIIFLYNNKSGLIIIFYFLFQKIAYSLPLVYIFEEARNILINQTVNYQNILNAFYLNVIYLVIAISLFYYSFGQARKKGTLINIGE